MKTRLILALLAAVFTLATGILIAGPGKGSHPDEKSNGIGSSRFPNHYASPTHPEHP